MVVVIIPPPLIAMASTAMAQLPVTVITSATVLVTVAQTSSLPTVLLIPPVSEYTDHSLTVLLCCMYLSSYSTAHSTTRSVVPAAWYPPLLACTIAFNFSSFHLFHSSSPTLYLSFRSSPFFLFPFLLPISSPPYILSPFLPCDSIHTVSTEVRLNNQHPNTPGSQYSGLLEVYHNGQWGTVCNTSWTFQNSLVVCKLLGFPSVEHFYTSGTSYPGNGY